MKKQLLFIAVLLCACLAGGCKDDDPSAPDSLYMHSTSGTVEAAAGTQSVTIYTFGRDFVYPINFHLRLWG